LAFGGRQNTAYFHKIAKLKNSTKLISSLGDGDNLLTDPTLIANHVVNFYNNLFATNHLLQDFSLVDEVIPELINDNVNALLTMIPNSEEIKSVVFGLNSDGAPGPDGFGAFFFQRYWEIIKFDVENAVIQLTNLGLLPWLTLSSKSFQRC
jgi:hypothetical protein